MRLGRGQTIGTPSDPSKRVEVWLPASELAKLDGLKLDGESRGDVVRWMIEQNEKTGSA